MTDWNEIGDYIGILILGMAILFIFLCLIAMNEQGIKLIEITW